MDPFEAIAVLDEPVRRGLYEFVRRSHRAVTREEAAASRRISVKLAAFHLEKLAASGLLQARSDVPEGVRRKVGRVPKRYELSDLEVSLSLPERHYDLLGEILLDVLVESEAGSTDHSPNEAAIRIARERGRAYADRAGRLLRRPGPERTIAAVDELLEELGFQPANDGQGGLILLNCPFHVLMRRAPDLVCGINAAFVDGLLRGLGNESVRADLEPGVDRCCVCVRPS
jgi:predicted ArsR family transcriptional regulator